ncbi:YdcF family protein [uncultured Shewanella sp.]|uniref:YdcF family protein n=1 Tax=uncultured Shewanella sp. TaxID=173975 RepID=UPI002629C9FD|nr:YdcF family protein [uncultured Shewanella sp.]
MLLLLVGLVSTQSMAVLNTQHETEAMLLADVLQGFKQGEEKQSQSKLNALIQSSSNPLNLLRQGLTMGGMFDNYDMIFDFADRILVRDPNDIQALYLKALYSYALMRPDYAQWRDKLTSLQPAAAEVLEKIIVNVDNVWKQDVNDDLAHVKPSSIGIIALGSPANADGSPKPRLLNTLKRTLILSRNYPQASIFVTGAAVQTRMPESVAMKQWLVKQGVSPSRIIIEDKAQDTMGNASNLLPIIKRKHINQLLLVTVSYHMRRSSLIFNEILQDKIEGYRLLKVSAESDLTGKALSKRLEVEKVSSYRDLSRAIGLYHKEGFN